MTTVTLNIMDESKAGDVLRFLRDIEFLEVSEPTRKNQGKTLGMEQFRGINLGWSKGEMTRDEMNAR
jgi:hypothetical protein